MAGKQQIKQETAAAIKQANPAFLEDIAEVEEHHVSCDGGALGHPLVYLEIAPGSNEIACPYCSRIFRLKAGH